MAIEFLVQNEVNVLVEGYISRVQHSEANANTQYRYEERQTINRVINSALSKLFSSLNRELFNDFVSFRLVLDPAASFERVISIGNTGGHQHWDFRDVRLSGMVRASPGIHIVQVFFTDINYLDSFFFLLWIISIFTSALDAISNSTWRRNMV